jgi:O-antigen ligase
MQEDRSSSRTPWLTAAWLAGFAFSLQTGIFLAQVFASAGFLIATVALLNGWIERTKFTVIHYLLIANLIWLIVAAVASPAPGEGLIFVGNKFLVPLLGLVAVYTLTQQPLTTRWLIPALMVGGVFSALNGIIQYFYGVDLLYGQLIEPMPGDVVPFYLPVGLLNMALTFSGMQMLFFLMLLPWAWNQRGARAFWGWAGMALIAFSIVLAFRRGPWIGTAGIAFLFLFTRERKIVIPTVLAAIGMIISIYIFSDAFRTRVLDTVNMSTRSEQDRIIMWQTAWEMGKENPITGIGPGQWHSRAIQAIDNANDFDSLAHPHSDPLYLFAVSGYPGLVLAILVIAAVVLIAFRLFWGIPRSRDPVQALAQGGTLAVGGLVLAGLTQCYLLDGENMIAIGMILGIVLSLNQQQRTSEGLMKE